MSEPKTLKWILVKIYDYPVLERNDSKHQPSFGLASFLSHMWRAAKATVADEGIMKRQRELVDKKSHETYLKLANNWHTSKNPLM